MSNVNLIGNIYPLHNLRIFFNAKAFLNLNTTLKLDCFKETDGHGLGTGMWQNKHYILLSMFL